jgi:RNA polymerase sigma-70 factor (ECF subfamily)
MTNWPEVIRDHGPLVWRTAYRLLGHDADAADCFQQTFLAAVELNAAGPVRNWPAALRRIATVRALDQLRTRYRSRWRSEPLPDEPAVDLSALEPACLASGSELAAALRKALSETDPRQAQVFCLVCLDGLSHQDAADALGITANHAGVLLHRARVALRERLTAFDPNRTPTPGGRT